MLKKYGGILLGLTLLIGCKAKSPSQPVVSAVPPTQSPSGAGEYTVQVTAEQTSIVLEGGTGSATVRVFVDVQRSDGSRPHGETVIISTDNGTLAIPGSTELPSQSVVTSLNNGQTYVLFTTSGERGDAIITANFKGAAGSIQISWAPEEPTTPGDFYLSYVEPSFGNADGGYIVKVKGGGFEAPVTVKFGGIPAVVESVSSSQIDVRVPRYTGTLNSNQPTATVSVEVTIRAATGADSTKVLDNAFTYSLSGSIDNPVIYSITPVTGPIEGGTEITIRGDNFEAPVQVLFRPTGRAGQAVEGSVVSVSVNEIKVLSPPITAYGIDNPVERVDITVVNLSSGLSATFSGAFEYQHNVVITALSPGSALFSGGDQGVVYGQGFESPVAFSYIECEGVGSVAHQVVSVTGTEIVYNISGVQPSACGQNITCTASRVVNIDTGDSDDGPGFIYIVPKFAADGLSPGSGPDTGGTLVTITGNMFFTPISVTFAGVPATIVSGPIDSDGDGIPDTMTVQTPPFGGPFDTQSCDAGGGTPGVQNIDTAVDVVITSFFANSCEVTVKFIYQPSDTSCRPQ